MINKNASNELLSALSKNVSTEDLILASITSDIAVAITSKRLELEMTQVEFSEYMGKSQAMISKWENACCNFTLTTLVEIAQKLDLSLDVSLEKKHSAPSVPAKVIPFPSHYRSETSPSPVWTQKSFDEEHVELKEM